MGRHNSTQRARELRRQQTKSESLLWTAVRARRLCGLKFRRQHPIGPFFADFACVDHRLIVEIDGGYHDYQYANDAARQRYLKKAGWSILRFTSEDVLDDVQAVAISIAHSLGLEPCFGERKSAVSGMMLQRKQADARARRDPPQGLE